MNIIIEIKFVKYLNGFFLNKLKYTKENSE